MGEHLILCGNKTDECPNCHKFIRRAIFAYHYENNCANLDETETDDRSPPEQMKTISRSHSNNATSSSSEVTTGNNKQISIIKVDLTNNSNTNITTSKRLPSGRFYCDPFNLLRILL